MFQKSGEHLLSLKLAYPAMVLRRIFLPSIQQGKVSGKCHMEPKHKKQQKLSLGIDLISLLMFVSVESMQTTA